MLITDDVLEARDLAAVLEPSLQRLEALAGASQQDGLRPEIVEAVCDAVTADLATIQNTLRGRTLCERDRWKD